MARHLLLRLEAPLMAFGGETIDNFGVIRDFPALSMITGLLANALGWRREDTARHDRLQERLVMGARIERQGIRLQDNQNARLGAKDVGWTTWGVPEERAGGAGTYESPHRRFRDYHASQSLLVAMRLEPSDEPPTLDGLAAALDHPARPLFIGRKPCLPSCRVFAGWQDGASILETLQSATLPVPHPTSMRAQWPDGEGTLPGDRLIELCDERNWTSGVHGGWRPIREGRLRFERQPG
ncbi:type I-E CRISPR-associated protein Cas5/CasD [Marichromatium gracile]|uniref:CRISPR-associated Cas5e family protein n=1 Tax=Marichromatium gracile TaxID=1048 RepID=A0A4R4A508_MARGR|nr:type I-E CRISPR-associated protein Cas5/CasD [Marichromatium gracile]MBK1709765.1 type I-E CRISPR-associated protein Cas5/CasD [Marichromatium gracile]TCW33289.1 CRISPR-associated Cas5e family protein [Marichromatium gracile]